MHNFLSIDWDFFSYSPHEMDQEDPDTPRSVKITDDDGKRCDAPLRQLLDWGGTEAHGGLLNHIIWTNRIANMLSWGIDPRDVIGLLPRGGNVMPQPFTQELHSYWPELERRSRVVYYGDSHAMGVYAVNAMREAARKNKADTPGTATPVRVIHFDAHHDMGYRADQVYEQQINGLSDCASWLWHMIDCGTVEEVVFVMPNWTKGYPWTRVLDDIDGEYRHVAPYLNKIVALTWDEWLSAQRPEKTEAISVSYVCRSGTWVPPWLDDEFMQFVKGLASNTEAFDAAYCAKHQLRLVGADIAVSRDWSWAAAKAHADAMKRMRTKNYTDHMLGMSAGELSAVINKGEDLDVEPTHHT